MRLDSQELLGGRQDHEGVGERSVVGLAQSRCHLVECLTVRVGPDPQRVEVPEFRDQLLLVADDHRPACDEHVGLIGGHVDVCRPQPQIGAQLAQPGAIGSGSEGATFGHRATIGQHRDRPPRTIPVARRVMATGVLLRLPLDETGGEPVGPVVVDEVARGNHS